MTDGLFVGEKRGRRLLGAECASGRVGGIFLGEWRQLSGRLWRLEIPWFLLGEGEGSSSNSCS